MSAKSKLIGAGVNLYLSSRPAKYALHGVGRLLSGGRRRARLYYRADDPYSHLLVQSAAGLVAEYGLEIEIVPVAPPGIGANPAPEMLLQHAMREASILAEVYGLGFPPNATPPSEDRTRRAHAVLLERRPADEQLAIAAELGAAVWGDDGEALATLVERYGAVSGEEVTPALESNYSALERAGHYQPGMLHYGGEWYWGIDRLHYLEERLRKEGLDGGPDGAPGPSPRLATSIQGGGGANKLEVFVSFRSPYSYLAICQLIDLRDRCGVDVTVRPVLPMVMRGLAVPRAKRLYIVRDAKREADRLRIPFGHVCDPLGKGIGYCMASFFHCVEGTGRELAFTRSVMQGIWSEARDVAHLPDLIYLAERGGLSEAEVRAAIEDRSWKPKGQANRDALTDLGFWGVPSLRIGSYSTWGQDRIPMVEAEIARFSGPV
jgi:2-hydroxychromene-2-carboxylate isomerase